jgi:hypothetical protein
MTANASVLAELDELLQVFGTWLADAQHRDDYDEMREVFDRIVRRAGEVSQELMELAACCRLAVGALNGEDVPPSIHVQAGEDPADTARWQKWRVS